MKKVKLLMPLIGSGAMLIAGTTIFTTSCSKADKYSKYQITGGDYNLLGDKLGEGIARRAWKVVEENGKETEKAVAFKVNVFTALSVGETIDVDQFGIVHWHHLSVGDKIYTLKVIATITDTETKEQEVRATDTITIRNTSSMILQPPQADEAECNLFSVDAAMDRGDDTVGGTINGFQLINKRSDFDPTNTSHALVTVEEELPEDEGGLGEIQARIICTDDENHTYAIQFFSKALNPNPGNHKIKITIENKKEGGHLLQTTTFDVNVSFEVDSWTNVRSYADKGLSALQKHYGIDNFVGLSRTVPLNGIKHKVTVIGQNADIDKDGKKIALTFQFDTLICNVDGEALTLSLRDKKTDYWDSRIDEALNSGQTFEWEQSNRSSVYKMMDNDVSNGIKTVKKQALKYDSEQKCWQLTTRECKLFEPALGSFLSYQGFINSPEDLAAPKEKNLFMAEDHQYEYYANLDNKNNPFEYGGWGVECFARGQIRGWGRTPDYFLRSSNIHGDCEQAPGSFWKCTSGGCLTHNNWATPSEVQGVSPFFCI